MADYGELRRAIDGVYTAHGAGYDRFQRVKALADVFDEVLLALPRWVTIDMLSDSFMIAVVRNPDLELKVVPED